MIQSEIRIPNRLVSRCLSKKHSRHLRAFALAKLKGHRIKVNELISELGLNTKPGKNLVKELIELGYVRTDGHYLFPVSWRKLKLNKKGGLYVTNIQNSKQRFEALLYSHLLKKLYKKNVALHSITGRVLPELRSLYISKSLGLSERRSKRLKALSKKFGFISIKRTYTVLGKDKHYNSLKKNLAGLPIFIRGKYTVSPGVPEIKIKI